MPLDSEKARRRIESVQDLPTLPSIASEIIAIASSPRTNAADVGRMIEQDQALTAKVLKLVNSAFYGFPGQIRSIQHAVVIIGFNKVKNVVVTASVFDLSKSAKENRLDLPRFWEHSLGAAIGAKVACSAIGGSLLPEDAFVGGLMHDIGKLILDQTLVKEYEEVFAEVETQGNLLVESERAVLGFDHATVGSWIAERWKLPPSLHAAIRHHHRPEKASQDRDMAAAVHLGDIFARALGVGHGGDNRMPDLQDGVWRQYNLTNKFLDASLGTMVEELRKAEEFFGMITGD